MNTLTLLKDAYLALQDAYRKLDWDTVDIVEDRIKTLEELRDDELLIQDIENGLYY